MKKKRKILPVMAVCLILVLALVLPMRSYADDATVTFGSNWYDNDTGETFPVGVYIRSEGTAGNYNVTIRYNPSVVEYVSGADGVDAANGILVLSGTEGGSEIRYWLQFRAIGAGESDIYIESASVYTGNNEEQYNITAYGRAAMYVGGEDTAAEETQQEEEPPVEEVQQEEQPAQEVQQEGQAGEDGQPEDDETGEEILQQEEEGNGGSPNPVEINHREDVAAVSPEDTDAGGEAPASTGESANSVIPVITEETDGRTSSIIYNAYVALVIAVIFFIGLVVVIVILVQNLVENDKKPEDESEDAPTRDFKIIDLDDETCIIDAKIQSYIHDTEMSGKLGEPLIRVEDVTMEFHLSSYNPSGLKDYLIQMLKRQITYRKLFALYHVSFNVYNGEVLGIIGTNGSGKSTLVKIISGALKPTGGCVKVDHRKVQLLTLGTGFDMELTARENVYLNGSIIGYSKEFLDKNYDNIVEFAELQDFMEEKVKNFSSGMVSRLGFAIATAGEAAEILILDEVLSVGDEFFRKKSLNRIKEMIHGGSTVLLISHGMGTILENCTKVVWIEKGELKMIGEPKVVCEAYRSLNG